MVGKIAEVVEVLDLAGDGSGEVGACAWATDDDDWIRLHWGHIVAVEEAVEAEAEAGEEEVATKL